MLMIDKRWQLRRTATLRFDNFIRLTIFHVWNTRIVLTLVTIEGKHM